MSILDKHPAPWTFDVGGRLLDRNGDCIMCDDTDAEHSARWLILAAPELLQVIDALTDPCPLPSRYGDSVRDMAQFRMDWEVRGRELVQRLLTPSATGVS